MLWYLQNNSNRADPTHKNHEDGNKNLHESFSVSYWLMTDWWWVSVGNCGAPPDWTGPILLVRWPLAKLGFLKPPFILASLKGVKAPLRFQVEGFSEGRPRCVPMLDSVCRGSLNTSIPTALLLPLSLSIPTPPPPPSPRLNPEYSSNLPRLSLRPYLTVSHNKTVKQPHNRSRALSVIIASVYCRFHAPPHHEPIFPHICACVCICEHPDVLLMQPKGRMGTFPL